MEKFFFGRWPDFFIAIFASRTSNMKIRFVCFCLLSLYALCCSVNAQVSIVESDPGVGFGNIGYNSATGETSIIAIFGPFGERTYEVANLNANNDGFVYTAPANKPGAVNDYVISDISTDGSRLSGYVRNADSLSEALTWTTMDLGNVVEIGRPDDNFQVSAQALGAWNGGVVGSFTNWLTRWNADTGFEGTQFFNSNSFVDVSADGTIAVGQALGGAAVWEGGTNVTALADSFDLSDAFGISPDGNTVGGFVRELSSSGRAAIWEGDNWDLKILLDENNEELNGAVTDLTDNGYAVGVEFDPAIGGVGFIYHESWETSMELNDWLVSMDPSLSFDGILSPGGIHWDSNSDTLRLTVSSSADDRGRYIEVNLSSVPEPGVLTLLAGVILGASTRRRRND